MCTCHCRWVQNSRDLLEECFCHHVTGWKPKCWCWLVSKPWSVVSRQPLAPSCRKLLNLSGRTITETNQQRQSLSSSDLCVSVLWACEEASSARPSHSSIDLFNSVVRRGSVAQEQQLRLQYKNKTKQKSNGASVCVGRWTDGSRWMWGEETGDGWSETKTKTDVGERAGKMLVERRQRKATNDSRQWKLAADGASPRPEWQ